jgi:hypothetical protein
VIKQLSFYFLFIFLALNTNAQGTPGKVLAANEKSDSSMFCATTLVLDSSNFIYLINACEEHSNFAIDNYHISNDTIWIDKFDFIEHGPFLKVLSFPSKKAKQQIRFKNMQGGDIDYRYDHNGKTGPYATTISKIRSKEKWYLKNSCLTFPKNNKRVFEFILLNFIYKNPITFWVHKNLDYEVTINLPAPILSDLCIHSVRNFSEKYLLIRNNKVVFPLSKFELPIIFYKK